MINYLSNPYFWMMLIIIGILLVLFYAADNIMKRFDLLIKLNIMNQREYLLNEEQANTLADVLRNTFEWEDPHGE